LKNGDIDGIISFMDRTVYLLRFLWYIIKYLIIFLFASAVMIVGFVVAKDTANVYIIVTEGMEARAGTILNLTQLSELDKYFIEDYASGDFELATNKYDDFFIRDFEYKLKVESLWANPWENSAYVKAVETVPEIDGEYPVENEDEIALEMPEWQSSRYVITLIKIDDAWYINQVVKMESVDNTAGSGQ